MTGPGRFLSLEGGEGVGKTTQLKALHSALEQRGIDCLLTREPGGSPGAEAIRDLLLRGEDDRWSSRAEALLFAAARSDHSDKTIRPALKSGRWVLSDRYIDSSLAYQGGAGDLGIESVRQLHEFGSYGLYPDRTLVLIHPDGAQRANSRDAGNVDRIGGRGSDYHDAVDAAFRSIAEAEPDRVKCVDASGTEEQVTARLLDAIADLLP